MGFSDLPLELMYQIAEYLDFEKDINALVRTNKHSYSLLNGYLYRHHVTQWKAEAYESMCISGLSNSMRMLLSEGMPPDARLPNWDPFTLASMYGHEDIVKCLLEKGANPNGKQPMSGYWIQQLPEPGEYEIFSSPFDYAVKHGHEGTARLLVPHMESVDYFVTDFSEEYNKTPLILAAENGHLNLVKMLVEELKCNVEPVRYEVVGKIAWREMTPLAYAASEGHTDIVRYLLSVGADLDAVTGESWLTILGHAVCSDSLETVKALLEHGSNPDPFFRIQQANTMSQNEEDRYTYMRAYKGAIYPLVGACNLGNEGIINLLLKHIDWERILECGAEYANFLLPVAATCGLESMVQRLLKKGCDVNKPLTLHRRINVGSALVLASKHGHIGVVRILLDNGADPNAPDIDGSKSPLLEAVEAEEQQVAELLIDAGADPNATDRMGDPILSRAFLYEPMCRMLLNRGADPSTLTPVRRHRVLRDALETEDVPVLRALLNTNFGSSIVKEGLLFRRAMESLAEAETAMFECMLQYFWDQHGLKPSPESDDWYWALKSAIKCHNAEVVEIFLLRYGLELKSEDVPYYLTCAACANYDACARLRAETTLDVLLRHGVDINTRCGDGSTCLSLLSSNKKVQGAKFVIKRGAKYPLTYRDEFGHCLLAVVMKTACFKSLEILLGLIEAQNIPSEDIEPQIREAEEQIPAYSNSYFYDKLTHLRLERPLHDFRWRRRCPVPRS